MPINEYHTYGRNELPPPMQSRVESELNDGENLLWVGQPNPNRYMRQSFVIMFFGIFFTGFAVFWIAAASGMMFGGFGGGPPGGMGVFACFPLFGIPFVLVGLGMLLSPLWMRKQAKKTFYALTDRRAILWEAGFWGSVMVRSYYPDDLKRMRRNEYSDGSGDLIFEEIYTYHPSSGRNSSGGYNRTRHGFMGINNVREVDEIIRRVLISGDQNKENTQ